MIQLFFLGIQLIPAVIVYIDANKNGRSKGWAVLCIFTGILGIVIYFMFDPRKKETVNRETLMQDGWSRVEEYAVKFIEASYDGTYLTVNFKIKNITTRLLSMINMQYNIQNNNISVFVPYEKEARQLLSSGETTINLKVKWDKNEPLKNTKLIVHKYDSASRDVIIPFEV